MSRRPRFRDLVSVVFELREELRCSEREIQNLRRENEVLLEAAEPLIHHAPARERFAFIHARRERLGIRLLCRVLITDLYNYHGWVRAEVKRCERAYDDQRLTELVVEVHTAHPAYGAPRVTRELQRRGVAVGQRRVARLMREHGIAGVTRRRRSNLTKLDPGAAAAPDLIQREFTAPYAFGLHRVLDGLATLINARAT